jgi:hypothetical protein
MNLSFDSLATERPTGPTASTALDEADVREIAHSTRRDPRTVRRVLRGEDVRGLAGADIRRAIAACIAKKYGARPAP